eukprot:222175-Chlamydomonas_euryale.AAC.1
MQSHPGASHFGIPSHTCVPLADLDCAAVVQSHPGASHFVFQTLCGFGCRMCSLERWLLGISPQRFAVASACSVLRSPLPA